MERLEKHFKRLTRAVYEKHGFTYGEILAQWDTIVGTQLAACTRPLRIKWPRQAPALQKYGGVLLVQSLPGFALELNYQAPQLIERINSYFGYAAISSIKVIQGEFARSEKTSAPIPEALTAREAAELDERLAGIALSGLKNALARLAVSVKSRRQA
jgi:hypothetical protein